MLAAAFLLSGTYGKFRVQPSGLSGPGNNKLKLELVS
jgi:hypothetical protein